MTNYNLEEFKKWLEKQPECRRGHHKDVISYLAKCDNWKESLRQISMPQELFNEIGLVGWDLIQIWKNKVNQAERERERERESPVISRNQKQGKSAKTC